MQTVKWVQIKLFYNLSNRTFYVQIGETLYPVRDKVITAIQEKEGMEIRHAKDIKDMQEISLSDGKANTNTEK